jgi:hypothetical protein
MSRKSEDGYDKEETQRRFEKLVRTALNTPPKPMKDLPRKRPVPKGKSAKSIER